MTLTYEIDRTIGTYPVNLGAKVELDVRASSADDTHALDAATDQSLSVRCAFPTQVCGSMFAVYVMLPEMSSWTLIDSWTLPVRA